ncbi:MAG: NAD(P)-dependent oxidoreductase [Syntrophobacteraceae bacterium]
MKKLLITGASGFLGWNLCSLAQREWNVIGTAFRNEASIPGVTLRRVDLTRFSEVKKSVLEISPDAVIHTAGASSVNFCQLNPADSYKINVEATGNLAGLCADLAVPFVFTSSDMVFDGLNPPYSEDDPVCPINTYGEQKAEAEERVLEKCPEAAVCRIALIYGNGGFLRSWAGEMKRGTDLRLFDDEFRTPVSAGDASRGLLLALSRAGGLLHLAGADRISRFHFGLLLKEIIGAQARIIPCSRESLPMPAPRPADVSLDGTRAFEIGFRPGGIRQELEKLSHILIK